ncbi:ATP-binding protein [Nocardia farcinica]|jgi:DNA replication protein DnaC|uniref:IS21-like element helper ATPase IstB n=1 Tax=Nocardia TaxID=1817 RepID=UPI001893CCE6|nr:MULTISPECIES: IS21-like element helper ATPase IstB [Nocardia]MBF6216130.1 ATP-binding protein [Nocardia puris]MBF6290161.1 ATP-binding protein [Nocardia cyriacigeorgica]MBF6295888.1 ATP-binding protein [Nocardia farcinica]MBF6382464.1 ATP-binding protein [Nocardia farcinica]MBF6423010.1 ATP-binding protein [Nocardia farcinica]
MSAPSRVTGPTGDPLAEAIALTKRLKLPYLRRALTDLVPTAKAQRWDPAEVVRVLLAEEAAGRDATNLRTRRKRAGFPAGKTFGDWDESASSIPRPTQDALKTLEWVRNTENLCICGPSGTGKSHFCEALGQAAVEAGLTVAWFTIEDLGALMRRHRVDDSVSRAITRLIRTDLIIIDDIGLLPVSPDAAEGFYRLVDAAYERRALAVSSNLHPSGFDEIMPKTLATATVDRLLHHAHVVVTDGDSYRLTQATNGEGVKPLR